MRPDAIRHSLFSSFNLIVCNDYSPCFFSSIAAGKFVRLLVFLSPYPTVQASSREIERIFFPASWMRDAFFAQAFPGSCCCWFMGWFEKDRRVTFLGLLI